MTRNSRGTGGFTLLEILVAMAIFAMIGLASTGVLTSVINSNQISQERFAQLQTLQRAMITIERDVLQAIARPVRINGEKTDVVMRGGQLEDSDADGLAFVRGGWHNPQMMLARSTQQTVAYRLSDNKLERLYSNYVDNVIGYEPKVRVLLEGVTDFQVEFVVQSDNTEAGDDTSVTWNDTYTGAALPKAIAITLQTRDFGTIRREFTLWSDGL
ncbi:type II secretion system minor pseudopilin GspJ [Salinimonas marina]|uniref:Type II secretion system protein J n=1 Tax=Salinimonas marina TaxID=2785918 RepID=A0A7S9DX41_9ALTE|nr:type II secretion system minor pseudopilin GspJ [Salinimonas marina]QPG05574.1 type II secretion system minor pseudopilin GspJ [Salinimonas marina]